MHGFVRSYEILSEVVKPDTVVIGAQGVPLTGADIVRHKDMYWALFKQFFVLFNKGFGPEDVVEFNKGKEFVGVVPVVADRPLKGLIWRSWATRRSSWSTRTAACSRRRCRTDRERRVASRPAC